MSALTKKEFTEIGEVFQNTYSNPEEVKPFLTQLIKDYSKREIGSWAPLVPLDPIEVMLKDESFKKIVDFALETIKELVPTFPDIETYKHNADEITSWPVEPYVINAWGVLNKSFLSKGEGITNTPRLHPHRHIPATWTFTYYIDACENCSPLMFSNCNGPNAIKSKTGDIVIFPGWVTHSVAPHKCDHDRISIAGNVAIKL